MHPYMHVLKLLENNRQLALEIYVLLAGNCSYREDCVLKDWSDWSGKIPDVGCALQMRTRDYNKSEEWIERATCDGLDSCPAIREETRTKCKLWTRY